MGAHPEGIQHIGQQISPSCPPTTVDSRRGYLCSPSATDYRYRHKKGKQPCVLFAL